MGSINGKDVRKIVVACDAGMGSSVMLASQLRKQLKKFSVTVEHTPVNSIPADADVVVTHTGLAARAPYFMGGAADTLREMVDFSDRRFNIGYTEQEKQDLVNFMSVL